MRTACVILAAGMGKRMRSKTQKVLHAVCGEPMISYPVSLALKKKFNPVVVVVRKETDEVARFLKKRFGDRIQIAEQGEPKGTGHAVMSAKAQLRGHKGKFVVLYGDVPLISNPDLSALLRRGRSRGVAFLTGKLTNPAGYGRVVRDPNGRVQRIVEDVDASPSERALREINTGCYLLDTRFAFSRLKKIRRSNAQGEYYLTDLIEQARQEELPAEGIELPDVTSLLGINDREELARSEALLNLRFAKALMKNGVTIVDPSRTCLGPDVRIGKDTILEPGCSLRGRVRIGASCWIGPGACIRDSSVGNGVLVRAYSVLEECSVHSRAVVGPFSRLRPGAVVGTQAHVGNFVEMKKTTLGKGSKANHLSYLGDAMIGNGVNVGAGTITCNYDGFSKYSTEIGDGVFIGSDTQLVAPVRVGKHAVVGAGTTITSDVPEGALAISRVRQTNIAGYTRRKKRRTKRHKKPGI
jgi:bifunctional UDP-N-acetylglucosamine pyrophosphorylase / glucosamine-1-phosphate N-acetyltransferase